MKTLRRVSTVFGAVIAVALMCAATALALERPAPSPSAHDPHESDKARGDGIKVHGQWTIDVRNADGTLASHNEFENACWECGNALSLMMTRQLTPWQWGVLLTSYTVASTTGGPCRNPNTLTPFYCSVQEGTSGNNNGQTFLTLTVSSTADGRTHLAGNFTASFDGSINLVHSTVVPIDGSQAWRFSERFLPTPIQVAAGQRVYVTVSFSFS